MIHGGGRKRLFGGAKKGGGAEKYIALRSISVVLLD